MIPHRTPFFLPMLYPSLRWRVPTTDNEIYLTFDDGPVEGPTEFALDELKKAAIVATFFCIGDNIGKFPHIFKQIVLDGHAIGNHTFNHLNGWKTQTKTYLENIALFETNLQAIGQKVPTLFRPPYGRISRAQIRLLTSYDIVMWDVLSYDYDKHVSPETCLRKTIKAVRPGSIIVFHDSLKAERNMMYALPRLIDHFKGKGFSFKSLSS